MRTDKMTNEKTTETNTVNPAITQDALAHLGDGRLDYVKTIRSEDDHANRHARSRACQRLEPGARSRERALKFARWNEQYKGVVAG
jgi:hypothetical protein